MVALLVALLALAVASCATPAADDPLADHSFLTQQPCASPCWYGLEPDKSSADEVYATLKTLPFVDPATAEATYIWADDENAKNVGFGCLHPKDEKCGGSIILSQGKLKRLAFSPPRGLTFQKAVEVLSQPDSIQYEPFHAEVGGCVIDLIWSQKGVYITSIDRTNEEQCRKIRETGYVSPDVTVTQIFYVTPKVFESGPNGFFNARVPWPGFAKQ